jgi:arsenate reductase
VIDLYRAGRFFDYVITVCDEATAEQCPVFPGVCKRLHWTFPDPGAGATPEAKLELAIEVRDMIRKRLASWLAEIAPRSRVEST